jgi:hypothetical protein
MSKRGGLVPPLSFGAKAPHARQQGKPAVNIQDFIISA